MNRDRRRAVLLGFSFWTLSGFQSLPMSAASTDPVLSWTMSGGIAALCEELSVWPDGRAESKTCKFGGRSKSGKLRGEELQQLESWTRKFGIVGVVQKDSGTHDSMEITLKLQGSGKASPSDSEKQDMLQWALRVYNFNHP